MRERQPLPDRPSEDDYECAVEVLAIDLSHDLLPICEEFFSQETGSEDPILTRSDVIFVVCGVDGRNEDRGYEDLDRVEREAVELLCGHFGLEVKEVAK